jgi:hypothetical protein
MTQPTCDECGALRAETVHAIAAGTIYRFCSDGCRRRFRFARSMHWPRLANAMAGHADAAPNAPQIPTAQ